MSDARRPCVLVTGGTGVVGRAVVRELVRRGARVGFTFHTAEERAHALSLNLFEEEARRERERANP